MLPDQSPGTRRGFLLGDDEVVTQQAVSGKRLAFRRGRKAKGDRKPKRMLRT
jgi:hypothetical protein